MKTKPIKEELDRSIEDEATPELTTKTRAQKKAAGEELNKANQEEPKKSRKAVVRKPKGLANKKTLGVRKTLRNKKVIIAKNKLKNVVTQGKRRGRKPAIKVEPQEDEAATDSDSLISPLEIKKEPVDETSPGSRSSSPKSQGKRVRLSSDMAMMKSLLLDSPGNLVIGPRTSPYSMRSERSNSPSLPEGKKRGRKPKTKLLNEVVKNEEKKRRLLSDSKGEPLDDDGKKRGRSHSRDGSEISKCSDITESDISEIVSIDADKSETPEHTQKLDKMKTDIDVNSEPSIPISTNAQVPFNDDSKLATEMDHSNILVEGKKKSLKRSTSLDSDNNNGRNRLKLDKVRTSSDVEGKSKIKRKTDKDSLFKTRSSILSSMSKTFNSKDMIMNIRKVRRGRKPASVKQAEVQSKTSPSITSGIEPIESGSETLESLTKEINELISTLEDDKPQENMKTDDTTSPVEVPTPIMPLDVLNQTKSVSKFYGLSEVKPLTDSNILPPSIEVSTKDKESWNLSSTIAPPKIDDSENIKLYLDDNNDKEKNTEVVKENEATFKPVASIDKLMDRLKVFEEFDKKRQQTEQQKTGESKTVMVTNDVVLIPKSGADIKPLKDIQSVRSPERPMQKENVLSCFENNSAISIMKRDHVRKSMDVDLPNSVTLIKRNSVHARKESTGSNHSRESSDTVMIFEKSLGKDVTLTEIRKSIDKSAPTASLDIHQFASMQPVSTPGIIGVKIDSNEISITPRTTGDQTKVVPKLKLQDLSLMKTTENEMAEIELLSTAGKIKSPQHVTTSQIKSPTSIIPPVAIKSPEALPIETEASAPPLETVKAISDNISMTSDTPRVEEMIIPETSVTNINDAKLEEVSNIQNEEKPMVVDNEPPKEAVNDIPELVCKAPIEDIVEKETEAPKDVKIEAPKEVVNENEVKTVADLVKPVKAQGKSKSGRKSIESQPGPSSALQETPESQKDKESILRTLGLLTHKAANEAKIEKQKQKEKMYAKTYGLGGVNKSKAPKSGDYTGTLKTIIKLNRGNGEREKGKKYRSSLKMTFQKSKNRAGKAAPDVEAEVVDEPFYTIERREGTGIQSTEGQRKSYSNRNNPNNHDGNPAAPTDVQEVPKEPTLNLVIPEKASSFSIHPGRLCLDQCSYCGGKFGLFDTPCHIAQMKSAERQKKVLANEEKLTIDSCLCDACYRHVDRRANCPSYRKRPLPKAIALVEPAPLVNTELNTPPIEKPSPVEKPPSPPVFDDESSGESAASLVSGAICHARGCGVSAVHAVRRKWLIKMKTKVHDLLELELDYPGLHTIPLCGAHHRALLPLITCRLCNRNKHHNLHLLKHGYLELNPLLAKEGIPVEFTDRPVLCKLCRYYCTLLQRPGFHDKNAKTYRNRLLQIYNIEIPPETEVETDDKIKDEKSDLSITIKQKKKNKAKSKQRKSIEPELINDNAINEPIVEIREGHEETKTDDPMDTNQPEHMEEDIESLISSNKILNPSKPSSGEVSMQSDISDQELLQDLEGPLIPFDKQTELQYLLQKQNNPAQFLKKNVTNLTPKQKNIFKTLNITIQKSGQQQKILDKNAKKIQKIGQMIIGQREKSPVSRPEETEEAEKVKEAGIVIIKNMSLNDECTIETIPNKKPADINTLKNKWQMSESFTQVKKNLSELSKKTTTEVKKPAEPKISNPVKRLETNPSISVRELFPGEDEMNLQCNIDFHNVKGITPEGWEKCNTTIQYDLETKKLWNELQRPYGNQSSFLRHLILLEKYFRSGDLILSNNATAHATVYSDSVQNRLKAYDNVPNNEHRPANSMKKPSVNGKSLLKSNNQNEIDKVPEMKKPLPPGTFVKPKPKTDGKAKTKTLPPELISIHTPNAQGRKAIQNVLHNIQQLVKDVSAADPIGIASAPLPPPKVELPKPEVPNVDPVKPAKKPKSSSKPWRPTLMPITPENLAKIAREQPQTAVDGRTLPSLVQVLSSGKRFHITLQDYNKMCIMRREKLQQLQDGDGKSKTTEPDNTIITEVQLSSKLGNGGTVRQTFEKDTEKPEVNDNIQLSMSAANILKNVGLKNITIAPIPPKTSTVTSQINLVPNVTSQMNLGPNVTSQINLVPNVTSQINLGPNVTSQINLLPNASSQMSFLQPATSHSNSLPTLMSQINLVPNATSQMNLVPNLMSKMNSVPNVMSQMSSVQSVMSQMSSIQTVMPQMSSIQTVTSPSLLVTSTPIKLQQLATIPTDPLITNVSPVVNASTSVLPKMPKSLTVIPQSSTNTVPNVSNDVPIP